jgi:diguanylate cyclase (GGDEF)-like protein
VPPVRCARGTFVALGFSSTAALLALVWARGHGIDVHRPALQIAALVLVPALAGLIVPAVAPRGAWMPATPLVIAAGLLGGPLVGAAAGAATQLFVVGSVWRYRLTWAGVAALEGFGAGVAGELVWARRESAFLATGLAILLFLAINQAASVLVALERRIEPRRPHLKLGLAVDVTESCFSFPLLSTLLATGGGDALLAVGTLAGALTVLAVAHRVRGRMLRELDRERAQARRDPLTGAKNRLALEEALRSEHARVVRGKRPTGVFFIDVDRFRDVNNRHGYAFGDTLLRAIYERLCLRLRPTDLVFRWGGEEFVILVPELGDTPALVQFAERIRRLFPDILLISGPVTAGVTVSVGGTLLDGSVDTSEVLDYAGRLVRIAKQTRNTAVTDAIPSRDLHVDPARAAAH